jgi:hypothetical protein
MRDEERYGVVVLIVRLWVCELDNVGQVIIR